MVFCCNDSVREGENPVPQSDFSAVGAWPDES